MNPESLKVAFVGPCEAGKTRLANHLAHEPPRPAAYEPTRGVRILSFEREVDVGGRRLRLPVELWDVAGEAESERGWPAVAAALDAVVVVFDPTSKAQATVVKPTGKYFVERSGLREGQVAVFAHGHLSAQHKPIHVSAGEKRARVPTPIYNVNLDGDAPTLADTGFDDVLARAYAAREAEDAEEDREAAARGD